VPIIAFFVDPSPIEDPAFIGEARSFMKTIRHFTARKGTGHFGCFAPDSETPHLCREGLGRDEMSKQAIIYHALTTKAIVNHRRL
jgi:hypothetical protein